MKDMVIERMTTHAMASCVECGRVGLSFHDD